MINQINTKNGSMGAKEEKNVSKSLEEILMNKLNPTEVAHLNYTQNYKLAKLRLPQVVAHYCPRGLLQEY